MMFQVFGRSICTQIQHSAKQSFLSVNESIVSKTSCRTTFILRRKHPVPLIKQYLDPNKWVPRKKRHKVYELEQFTEILPEGNINVILKSLVHGLGGKGDVVSVKRSYAYFKLLLPGLAEYATPEAIKKAEEREKTLKDESEEERFSSKDVPRTMNVMKNYIIKVVMHQENKWVLEPWHIRASFRKSGIHVMTDDSIEMPKQKIEGPDLNIEGKEFLVTITINKKEKVLVRCRLHHWHPDIMKRIPSVPYHWTQPAEPLFKEDAEILASMPLPPLPKNAISSE